MLKKIHNPNDPSDLFQINIKESLRQRLLVYWHKDADGDKSIKSWSQLIEELLNNYEQNQNQTEVKSNGTI